jgi:hypothetical protein
MLNRKHLATVSGLIGVLAAVCAGGGQAYAGNDPKDCTTTAEGETTCVHKTEVVHKGKNGTYVVKQTQKCSTVYQPRLTLTDDETLATGTTKVGPEIDCSNTTPLPKGYHRPKIDRPHVERPHLEF